MSCSTLESVWCREISLLLEMLIRESEPGRRISQRNVYIVRAIELINMVTDKGEFISLCG